MEIAFPRVDEKTRGVSCRNVWGPGTVLSGALLTALTVMKLLAAELLKAVMPPFVEVFTLVPALPLV